MVLCHGSNGQEWFKVAECDRCWAKTGYYDNEAEAAEAWNQRAERTCKVTYEYRGEQFPHSIHVKELSCGHEFRYYEQSYVPNYCPQCGAKVVSND